MHFTTKFLFTCLLYLVESSHFRGGTISWKPTKNNQVRDSTLHSTCKQCVVFVEKKPNNFIFFL